MKHVTLLILLPFALFTNSALGQESVPGEKRDSFAADGVRELSIYLDTGFTVEIRGNDTQALSYHYEFEGNRLAHERNFKNAQIEFEKHGTEAAFMIRFPELEDLKNVSWIEKLLNQDSYNFNVKKQNLVLELPRDLAIQFNSQYSNVDVSGIQRNVSIETRSGQVRAQNLGSDLRIQNEYGTSNIENIGGNVMLNSRSSKETVLSNVKGTLRVNSYYSTIRITDVGAETHIQNRSGDVTVENVQGPVEINGDYTKVRVAGISNAVRIQSKSGEVNAENIRSLRVDGEYTNIEASHITGTEGVDIQGRSSTIKLGDIQGRTQISGEYLDIRLNNLREDVHISNRAGSVAASRLEGAVQIQGEYVKIDINDYLGSKLDIDNRSNDVHIHALNTLSDVSIRAVYGDVNLVMEKDFAGEYLLDTLHGEISSNVFPVDQIEMPEGYRGNNRNAPKVLRGTLGDSQGSFMRIETQNGNISVRKQ